MEKKSLEQFVAEVKKNWGPLSTQTVENCYRLLKELTQASDSESWMANLILRSSEEINEELYRDPEHGFVLLAHAEHEARYRIPHDHGSGWVLYAIIKGETEMRTYGRVMNPKGRTQLVRKDVYRMKAGDCRLYLPGDIHDTRCISQSVLMLRLTSCDLKIEDRAGRLIRYLDQVSD